MNFAVVCKVCKAGVEPGKLLEHVQTHPPAAYFDVVPIITEWGEERGKRK
jgi:hypothetical protein